MRTLSLLTSLVFVASLSAQQPQAQHFEIRGKFTFTDESQEKVATIIPGIIVVEGKQAKYRTGGTLSSSGNPLISGLTISGGLSVQAKVKSLGHNRVRLHLSVEHNDPTLSSQSGRVRTLALTTVRDVTLGKPATFVLEGDTKGVARTWLEVTVSAAKEAD